MSVARDPEAVDSKNNGKSSSNTDNLDWNKKNRYTNRKSKSVHKIIEEKRICAVYKYSRRAKALNEELEIGICRRGVYGRHVETVSHVGDKYKRNICKERH